MAVLVLDKRKCPPMPCSEKRARLLLEHGQAVVVRRYPFTIRLRDRVGGATQPVRIKIDPGSKTTGIALVADADGNKPVKASSGGRTKYNRCRLGIPKRRAFDAACIGKVDTLTGWRRPILDIRATGRGSYCRTRLDAYGFPRGYCVRQKGVRGFQTGDIVRADIAKGKKTGTYVGRLAVRVSGSFNVQTPTGVVQGINVRLVHRSDGYSYRGPRLLPTDKSGGNRRGQIR